MHTLKHVAELILVNGDDSIVIRGMTVSGADAVICKSWDLGAPELRYTTVPNPGADGITYSDGFIGARTVTFDLAILGGPAGGVETHDAYWYVNKLTKMTLPTARPYLKIRRIDEVTGGGEYRMDLRGSPYSLTWTARSATILELQLMFVCPLGLLEGELRAAQSYDVSGDEGYEDWIFPAEFPKGFGMRAGLTYPMLQIHIGGDVAISPVLYFFGPSVNPEVFTNDGERFRFLGITLAGGEGICVDMGTGNIRFLAASDPPTYTDVQMYNAVDWAVSTFWRWNPGLHTITYPNTQGTIRIEYRERRLTI